MSLEQSLSKKLTVGPAASHQQQQDGIPNTSRNSNSSKGVGGKSSSKSPTPVSTTENTPKSSPSKSVSKLSLKGLGRSSTSAKRSRSPVKRQLTIGTESADKEKEKKNQKLPDLGEFIPGTSGCPAVDHSPFYNDGGASSSSKGKTANKIIHNWKSACKDKTKDFIRRWKTLPENHPDFDQIGAGAAGGSSSSAANKGSGSGSNTNITGGTTASGYLTSGGSNSGAPTSGGVNVGGISVNINNISPSSAANTGPGHNALTQQLSSGSGPQNASAAEMVNPNQTSSNSSTSGISGLGKLKNLGKNKQSSDSVEVAGAGIQGLSISSNSRLTSALASNANGQTQHDDMQANGTNKSSTGWSVHVWATYVQRGHDDVTLNEDPPPGREFLSEFQKVKLTHFFRHVLDMNHDDVISAEDFVALNQRIRHYIEWSSECIEFHILKEVHSGFLECFLNQPLDDTSVMYYCNSERETRENVNIEEWLDVWGTLLNTARTLEALPLWLQYFPKILFQVVNKSGSGTISREELRAFYTMFLGIDFRVVNDTLDSIYNAMTDSGRSKITYGLFKLCFVNFLLGKYPHGPGQYLFGICQPASLTCAFPIDYSALNTPKDDLEPYDPDKDKGGQSNRRSVIVRDD